ncbi:hypothetical protein C8J56DRAFT_742670, partial [Mycena floridula]
AARRVIQVALGVKIFGDVVNEQRVLSVLTISAGTLMYTWVKSREISSHTSSAWLEDLEMEK